MTKEEAREILIRDIQPYCNDNGETWYYKVGGFLKEYPSGFTFAVYPYSDTEPVNPKRAFEYVVDKNTGEVRESGAPFLNARDLAEAEKNEGAIRTDKENAPDTYRR